MLEKVVDRLCDTVRKITGCKWIVRCFSVGIV